METTGRWQAFWNKIKRGIVPLIIGVVLSIFAVGGLAEGIFSDTLVAGPDFVVSSPSVEPSAPGITTITPIKLDNDGLRIGWAVGSSMILAGLATGAFTAAKVLNRDSKLSLFGSEMTATVTHRTLGALLAISVGGVLRLFLQGRIATELGIDNGGLSPDDDFDLWVFDVPAVALLLLVGAVGWIWSRAGELQSEVEDIV